MSQFRTFEFRADDSTFELNQRLLGLIEPGVYRGFDWHQESGLNLRLVHTVSGIQYYDKSELLTDSIGVLITKQGVTIKETEDILLGIDVGGALPRYDAIVIEHYYSEVTGGVPGIYMVIKGTPGVIPVIPALTSPSRQLLIGYIYVPASMASLSEAGVVYTKILSPDWANNGFRARITAIESLNATQTSEISARMRIDQNGNDIANKATFRTNLGLGNHVTYNFAGSGGNYGSAGSIARGDHAHGGIYEPAFAKLTAFNKNFGAAVDTVCQGNDARLSDSRKCNNTFDLAATARTNLGLGNHVTYNFIGSGGNYGIGNSVARGDHKHTALDIADGTLEIARIPNLGYSKITSGDIMLYGYMHTRGYRISYDGEYGGIYIRSDGQVAIGETSGAADSKLYINGSILARDNDLAEGTTSGVGHRFYGKGITGTYPYIMWVGTSGVTADNNNKLVGLNIQLPVWNSGAGKYEWVRFMNTYGGVSGYIGNSIILGAGPGIEIWGLNDTHSPSDERLKKDIVNTKLGIKDLMKIKIRDFKYKETEELRTGMIAQELDKIFPDFVDKPMADANDLTNYWSIKYNRFIPLLIKAVQDLQKEIEKLKN